MNKSVATIIFIAALGIIVTIVLAAAGIVYSIPQRVECGACGAHTIDYWHINNMDNSALVEVCEQCYITALENDWPIETDHI